MVAELACRYRKPARYDEEVTIWTQVCEIASRKVVFAYTITGPNGEVLVEGETCHVAVSRASGRPVSIPPDLRAPFERVARGRRPSR